MKKSCQAIAEVCAVQFLEPYINPGLGNHESKIASVHSKNKGGTD